MGCHCIVLYHCTSKNGCPKNMPCMRYPPSLHLPLVGGKWDGPTLEEIEEEGEGEKRGGVGGEPWAMGSEWEEMAQIMGTTLGCSIWLTFLKPGGRGGWWREGVGCGRWFDMKRGRGGNPVTRMFWVKPQRANWRRLRFQLGGEGSRERKGQENNFFKKTYDAVCSCISLATVHGHLMSINLLHN